MMVFEVLIFCSHLCKLELLKYKRYHFFLEPNIYNWISQHKPTYPGVNFLIYCSCFCCFSFPFARGTNNGMKEVRRGIILLYRDFTKLQKQLNIQLQVLRVSD